MEHDECGRLEKLLVHGVEDQIGPFQNKYGD